MVGIGNVATMNVKAGAQTMVGIPGMSIRKRCNQGCFSLSYQEEPMLQSDHGRHFPSKAELIQNLERDCVDRCPSVTPGAQSLGEPGSLLGLAPEGHPVP